MIVANGFEARNIEELKDRMVRFYTEHFLPAVNSIYKINDDGSESALDIDAVRKFERELNDEIEVVRKENRTSEDDRLDRWESERGDR